MNKHYERISILNKKGFYPKVIYDIGAYRGEWSKEIKTIFPNSQFFLFEANKNNEKYLNNHEFPYFITLIGDENKKTKFYSINGTGDSVFRENTHYYQGQHVQETDLEMVTLSSLVSKYKIPLPELIKIDVQGAEHIVIQGAKDVLSLAEVIILETKILEYNLKCHLISDTIQFMSNLNYRMIDILELHYLPTQELNEIDILFVKTNSKLINNGMLI